MYYVSVSRVFIYYNKHPTPLFNIRSRHFHNNRNIQWFGGDGLNEFCSLLRKNISLSKIILNNNEGLLHARKTFFNHVYLLDSIKQGLLKIPCCLKEHSVQIVKTCTKQCECVVAHRVRRGQQIFSLYSKLWEEVALKEFVNKMRQHFFIKGREFILGAIGISAYNWEKERIPVEDLYIHQNELDSIHTLLVETVTCPTCQKRLIVDVASPSVSYCQCTGKKGTCVKNVGGEWIPFIERKDLLVWRKELEGLYAYKVYGTYSDVTADDFLQVQIDTSYRQEWDPTAIDLRVIDTDSESNSDVIYWEMQWPRLFANRDYVFNRRYLVDSDQNSIVIVNQGTEHPSCPPRTESYRVQEYWSYMVIKPYTSFAKPGIEFSLTYFENPGLSVPSTVSSWVSTNGLPDFMSRLREAAKELARRRMGDSDIGDMPDPPFPMPVPAPKEEAKTPVPFPDPPKYEDPTLEPGSNSYFTELTGFKLFM